MLFSIIADKSRNAIYASVLGNISNLRHGILIADKRGCSRTQRGIPRERALIMVEKRLLECTDVSKSFGPTKAVVGVDFSLPRGEIRGLIGENGSGKSTLCNIITGILKPDTGHMLLEGKPFAPASLLDSKREGISILLQETGTIAGMTVAENIYLGKEHQFTKYGTVDKRRLNAQAQTVIDEMGLAVSASEPIEHLSFENRKLVEVIRAMTDSPSILIVDETTTALSQYGREKIYGIIRQMKQENKSVIFITHDLNELMDVCDSATVLRDGHCIDTIYKEAFSEDRIRQCMIGRDLSGSYYRSDSVGEIPDEDSVVLDVRGVSLGRSVRKVSLQLRQGEILGIGGLTDCGMHELAQIMFGALRADEGEVVHCGSGTRITDPPQAIRLGMAYIPKDRDQASVFLASPIRDNVTVAATGRLMTRGFLSKRKEKEMALRETGKLSVKMQDINQLVRALSGGNKQKVAVAKWLANESDILIMDCPTRGIDIGVKSAIYSLMEQLKREKKSIIMISEELPELIGMVDRLLVMKDGRISGEFFRRDNLTEAEIIRKMI